MCDRCQILRRMSCCVRVDRDETRCVFPLLFMLLLVVFTVLLRACRCSKILRRLFEKQVGCCNQVWGCSWVSLSIFMPARVLRKYCPRNNGLSWDCRVGPTATSSSSGSRFTLPTTIYENLCTCRYFGLKGAKWTIFQEVETSGIVSTVWPVHVCMFYSVRREHAIPS